MNPRTYIRCITLLGKINHKYKLLQDNGLELTPEEKDLVSEAGREYDFYHAHERIEAGLERTNPDDIPRKDAEFSEARKRETLKLTKATR